MPRSSRSIVLLTVTILGLTFSYSHAKGRKSTRGTCTKDENVLGEEWRRKKCRGKVRRCGRKKREVSFDINLGFQGNAIILDKQSEKSAFERSVLDIVSATIDSSKVTTECVKILNQSPITLAETIENYSPQVYTPQDLTSTERRLGALFGRGGTGVAVRIEARCSRCTRDRLTDNAVNAINRGNDFNNTGRMLSPSQRIRSVCATNLLACLQIRLPQFYTEEVNFVITEDATTLPFCELDELVTCLNNNQIVSEGGDPVLRCGVYRRFDCRGRLEPVLGRTESQCVPRDRPTTQPTSKPTSPNSTYVNPSPKPTPTPTPEPTPKPTPEPAYVYPTYDYPTYVQWDPTYHG